MKIIKRSGSEDIFDISKIEAAIRKANDSVIDYEKLGDDKIQAILSNVEKACENMKRSPSVEEIQDMVENQIMSQTSGAVAAMASSNSGAILLIVIRENWCASPTLPMSRF